MQIDYIVNGRPDGDVADRLLAAEGDFGAFRPFRSSEDGQSYMTLGSGTRHEETVVSNTPALMMDDEWKYFDTVVEEETLSEMRLWGDIVGAGLTMQLPNAMGTTVITSRTRSRVAEATLSMDGLRRTKRNRPTSDIINIPVPIVHGDFGFSTREIEVSRRGLIPLDLTVMRDEIRACAEAIEKLTWGTLGSFSYGGGTIYGVTNHPNRFTATITLPTDPSWTPQLHQDEISSAVQSLTDNLITPGGPIVAYYSRGWRRYLNKDYSATYNGGNLRTRLLEDDLSAIRQADYLSNYQVVLLVYNRMYLEAVEGMAITTIQWQSGDGMEKMFKVLGIMLPRVRADARGYAGVAHLVAA